MKIEKSERKLVINSFRNIGFKDNKPFNEEIILNYSTNKKYIGDLVILIGPNNAGKSNVIEAIESFSKGNISNDDKNDTMLDDIYQHPTLTYIVEHENGKYEISLNDKNEYIYKLQCQSKDKNAFNIDDYIPDINNMNKGIYWNEFRWMQQIFANLKIRDINFTNSLDPYTLPNDDLKNNFKAFGNYTYGLLKQNKLSKELKTILKQGSYFKQIIEQYESYEKSFLPKIIRYEEKHIDSKNLICSLNLLENNTFFIKLFSLISKSILDIKNIITSMAKKSIPGNYDKYSREWTQPISAIADEFNRLYSIKEYIYNFEIKLDENKITFNIYRKNTITGDKNPLDINHQSTGFQWFFDFFFNVLADKNLKPGDIILMDEPATHLHTQGQEELRLFLKDFAVKNGVTFVLATHSPFFIDLNFLDEIRIVNLEGSDICHIENDFYAIKEDDTDTLLPIKEALTTKSNVLIDNDEIVIFVEGMMDYCYLTAMKFAFNDEFKNLVFIPIFGVGYNQEKSEQKIDKIKNLKKYDWIIFADGDDPAKNLEDNELKQPERTSNIVLITNINGLILSNEDEKKAEIEDLFTRQEKSNFLLMQKSSWAAILLKKMIINDNSIIDNQTKNNFRKVFEYLIKKFKNMKYVLKEEIEE